MRLDGDLELILATSFEINLKYAAILELILHIFHDLGTVTGHATVRNSDGKNKVFFGIDSG